MESNLDRREFLKLAGLLSLGYAIHSKGIPSAAGPQTRKQNILVVVYDALSAYNVSLHGYRRETTPNLARLAARAIVYHNHYAGGNFTTPGTASLLTGALPWTHRAFVHDGKVSESFVTKSIFHAFPGHYRIAYSHNPLVNTLLNQFKEDLDEYIPQARLFLASDGILQALFTNDEDIATVSWARTIKRQEEGYSYSLLLAHLYEQLRERRIAGLKPYYPRGIPHISTDNYFLLEQATDWVSSRLRELPRPFLGYFHFLPPHFPYKTHRDFYERFKGDGWRPPEKPIDAAFNQGKSQERLFEWRTWYDEFILYADREFGRLFDHLEASGLLEDTWVVFTSDHGEMFERGISGHLTHALYQPVIRIPLLIFEPGRDERVDVYTPTSAIDVLPTLLEATGEAIPDWIEGEVLPPFGRRSPDPGRKLYAQVARDNHPEAALTHASLMYLKGSYKLTRYFGYGRLGEADERIDLYNVEADPEELNELSTKEKVQTEELLSELEEKLAQVNEPYL